MGREWCYRDNIHYCFTVFYRNGDEVELSTQQRVDAEYSAIAMSRLPNVVKVEYDDLEFIDGEKAESKTITLSYEQIKALRAKLSTKDGLRIAEVLDMLM